MTRQWKERKKHEKKNWEKVEKQVKSKETRNDMFERSLAKSYSMSNTPDARLIISPVFKLSNIVVPFALVKKVCVAYVIGYTINIVVK